MRCFVVFGHVFYNEPFIHFFQTQFCRALNILYSFLSARLFLKSVWTVWCSHFLITEQNVLRDIQSCGSIFIPNLSFCLTQTYLWKFLSFLSFFTAAWQIHTLHGLKKCCSYFNDAQVFRPHIFHLCHFSWQNSTLEIFSTYFASTRHQIKCIIKIYNLRLIMLVKN